MKYLSIFILSFALFACGQSRKNFEFNGIITSMTGDVTVNSTEAKVNQILQKSDSISTENGTVEIQLRTGASVKLRQFTKITLTNLEEVQMPRGSMLVSAGKLRSTSDFRINTPTAVAGVRGTRFTVTSVDNGTEVAVLEGAVEVNKKIAKPNEKAIVLNDKSTTIIGAKFSSTEEIELRSMPVVNEEYIDNSVNDAEKPTDVATDVSKLSEMQKTIAMKDAYESVKNRRDFIVSENKSMEKINLKNGVVIVGYIVGQTKDVMIVFNNSKKKFEQINRFDVASQDF